MTFAVPAPAIISAYDRWAFYRNQIGLVPGAKAVDLLIIDQSTAYLVEVKDYRRDRVTGQPRSRSKPSELHVETAQKVLASLGGMLAAERLARDDGERSVASAVCRASAFRVVLHLEQPSGSGAIFNPANIQIKLRSILKGIDPHARVVSKRDTSRLPWSVTG